MSIFKFWRRTRKNQSSTAETSEPAIKYEVVASTLTDPGCVRETNEDFISFVRPDDPALVAEKGLLMMVADGMGGHSAGEVASRMAIDLVSRFYYGESAGSQEALKNALVKASKKIFEASEREEQLQGMGTTCTALVLKNGSALAAHVGDSRLYLIREGQIYLMTEDHSEVMEMVKRGLISLEEARHHPDKNVILRALGSRSEVEVSTWDAPFPVRESDRFLVCSDGLYDLVEDEEIKNAVEQATAESACERLVNLAKERGGHDNISVGIVNILPAVKAQNKSIPETREVEAAL